MTPSHVRYQTAPRPDEAQYNCGGYAIYRGDESAIDIDIDTDM